MWAAMWGWVQTAVNNEVMVAISNRNYAGPGNMLDIWMDNVVRAGVTNALVVALDSSTKEHVATKKFPVIEMHEQVCLRTSALCFFVTSFSPLPSSF